MPNLVVLSATFSADGNSATVNWPGGTGSMFVEGTWGSGTATLQYSIDSGSNWASVTDGTTTASLTADGVVTFTLGECDLRINLGGSTSPTLRYQISDTLVTSPLR